MRFSLRSMLVFTGLVALMLFTARVVYHNTIGPVIPYAVLSRLEQGMSKDDVQRIIDEPALAESYQWTYEKGLNPGWVEIHFNDQGEFVDFNDESTFPGFP